MKKPVLVIGHLNPDTDSVCSAIAYAYLKESSATASFRQEPADKFGNAVRT